MEKQYAIEVKNITKSFKIFLDKGSTLKEKFLFSKRRKYENRQVLKGISFNVEKGETLALIGHNGCGKSTTLKLLTRIMYPDSGEIKMNGRVSSLIELGAGFHQDMSGRENIYINASIFGLTKKEIDERLDDIIAFSELEEFIDNPVRTYSSGMYTRLAFAVAINVNADILLVDEILSVGDENFQTKCYERMRELKASGMTIVLVTHSLGTVKTFCDKAIWINDGLIAAEGSAYEVSEAYLSYMNDKRLKEISERSAQKGNRYNQNISAEAMEYDEKGEIITMDPSAIHYGNRRAVITNCCILNEKGEETTVVAADEKFKLKIDYRIDDATVDELVFGMGIYTLDRVWLFGINTQVKGEKHNFKGVKKGVVTFESEPLRLTTDLYILQVSIQDANGVPCDFYNEYSKFNVIDKSRTAGYFNYDCKWTVEKE